MRVRRGLGTTLLAAVLATALATGLGVVIGTSGRATGADTERCGRFAFQSAARARVVTGSGPRITVLGDSWSVGLGLAHPARSWPSRLPGRTRVLGFSGSGYAVHASPCRGVGFGLRVRQVPRGTGLVVVEGGLNDYDQPERAVRAGVREVLARLRHHRVVVVGPPLAPARARRIPRIDTLLRAECARAGVVYVPTTSLRLPYLADGLHLTALGHREFGDYVAARIRELRG